MAVSLLNSKPTFSTAAVNFIGQWEPVQDATCLLITIASDDNTIDTEYKVEWANYAGHVIFTETYTQKLKVDTTCIDIKAKYFKLSTVFGTSLRLGIYTVLQQAPTTIKLAGDTQIVASIHKGALKTIVVDYSGVPLKTSAFNDGHALYVSPTDASGYGIQLTSNASGKKSLGIHVKAGRLQNAVKIMPSNSVGTRQAATGTLELDTKAAFFTALADNSGFVINSTLSQPLATGHNALHVTLRDSSGLNIDIDNSLPIKNMGNDTLVSLYNVRDPLLSDPVEINLDTSSIMNIYLHNTGPGTAWVKLYDATTGTLLNHLVNEVNHLLVYNLAVPAQGYRDVPFYGGLKINNRIFLRATADHDYASTNSPGNGNVFASICYST